MHGFRGYLKPVRIDFAEGFTIVDGRNGVGKSTIFDAIEYALTGELSKYHDAKASGESVADYVWWTGEGQPAQRYVEVGFVERDVVISVRREQLKDPESATIKDVSDRLCDISLAPSEPLRQLCASTIIRDEPITSLSLDLKESDRYALLRDALGANDSDAWIDRGAKLVTLAKRRTDAAQQEVNAANADAATAARRIDEVRAALVSDKVLAEALQRLKDFANSTAPIDQLPGPTRERITQLGGRIENLTQLSRRWAAFEAEATRRDSLMLAVEQAQARRIEANQAVVQAAMPTNVPAAAALAEQAQELVRLIALGRNVGLQSGHCQAT
jgi:DNA repair exonuclease SbcCD ATPase subunit